MSTVSFSFSKTLSSSEHECDEERSSSTAADFTGYEYLSSNSSQCSNDIDRESETTMSEGNECEVDQIAGSLKITDGQAENLAQQRINCQPQQHAKLVWENPQISATSWTDQKHSLYLNSIEDAFIRRLYERGRYRYYCKRWENEKMTTFVSGKGLCKDIDPWISSWILSYYQSFNLFPEEKGTRAQMRWNVEDIQNCTKRSRLNRICIKQGHQEDINGRVNNCKYLKEPGAKRSTQTGHVPNEYSPRIQMQCCQNTYKYVHGRKKGSSKRYMQEDQVVPSMENTSSSS